MKRLLFAALLLMLVTGCTARATVDMSILQKWDRPSDNWKMETSNTGHTNGTSTTK